MLETKPLTAEEIKHIQETPMLFVLGKGRSGTSLLQNLLDAHPGIIGGPESKFAVIFYPCFAHIKKWKESDILAFVEKLYIEPLFAKLWNVDKKELTKTLLSVIDVASYALLCKLVYYQLRKGKENILYISDKNPEYILFIDTLLKIFPESKFIHIVREPRDNVYSQITSFKEKNTKFRAYQWAAYNAIVEKRKKKVPAKYLTMLYENLVSDPAGTMKKVSDFLNISFAESMTENKSPEWLKTHIDKTGAAKKEEDLIHRNLLKPIDTSNIGKWKNKMSPYDQSITEIITGDFAKKVYGYDIDNNKDNKPVKISSLVLLKGKCVYYLWQNFTQLKMKSFRFNLFYSRLKRKVNKKVPMWEYF